MNREEAYAQGARCGHLEGKDHEEKIPAVTDPIARRDAQWAAAQTAAKAQGYSPDLTREFAKGYEHGYVRALRGEGLEKGYVNG